MIQNADDKSGRCAGANGSEALSVIFSMVMTGNRVKALPWSVAQSKGKVHTRGLALSDFAFRGKE